jgi:hypothetical protein
MSRLENVLQAIDALNAKDPRQQELPYSVKLSGWVLRLNPRPSEALRIAARGQHVGRWTIPRASYPMNRGGYLRWREELKRFHAKTVGEIMMKVGYAETEIEPVRHIILKKNFQENPDAQTVEDALCLVFLESQFEELRQKTPNPKMIDILQKTWKKMSAKAKEVALTLELPPSHKAILQEALKLR